MLLPMLAMFMAQSVGADAPTTDYGRTEPRQDMGFAKSKCSFLNLPATLYTYGTRNASWGSRAERLAGVESGTLSFSIIRQENGQLAPSLGTYDWNIVVAIKEAKPADAILSIDGKRVKEKLGVDTAYPPGTYRVDLAGKTPTQASDSDRAAYDRIVKALAGARVAEVQMLDRRGKAIGTASWDVSKVRWLIAALQQSGFSCQPGSNSASR